MTFKPPVSRLATTLALVAAAFAAQAGPPTRAAVGADLDVIVVYDSVPGAAETEHARALGAKRQRGLKRLPMQQMRVPRHALAQLRKNPRVRAIVPDRPVEAFSMASRQAAAVPQPGAAGYMLASPAAGIAVLDSGVAIHADLTVASRIDCTRVEQGCVAVKANFSIGAASDSFPGTSYAGSNGPLDWAGDWQEIGETNGPGSGDVRVVRESQCASGRCLRLGAHRDSAGATGNRGVQRSLDLSGATRAELSYAFRRRGGSAGPVSVAFDASRDGGATWTDVATHSLDASDSVLQRASFRLEDFLTLDGPVTLRLRLLGHYPAESSRYLYIDDFEVVVTGGDAHDPFGHGTHVAGVAAGTGAASGGAYAGVARGATVHSVRVLDHKGRGMTSDVIAGLDWVLENAGSRGIRVVNLSLGKAVEESNALDPLVLAVERVWDAGIVVVASAGNYGRDGHMSVTSPGNSRKIITVGSLTDNGTGSVTADDYVSTYSSVGPTLIDHVLKPDLVAPGNRLVAAAPANGKLKQDLPERSPACGTGCAEAYLELSGTSMAAAMVSGAAALMLSRDPSLSPATVKARLMKSARKLDFDPTAGGAGVLNVAAALAATGTVQGQALSPKMARSAEAAVVLVEDTASLWGSPAWGAGYLWNNGYL